MATAGTPPAIPSNFTRAQWDALPPHLKLMYTSQLVHPQAGPPPLPAQFLASLTQNQLVALADYMKAKRPLNSWMAFRSYYNQIFSSLPQKKASPLLTMMWECDPFKAKWSVIARAYSTMRDWLGKDRVKLDQFLDLVCPQIGIIGRDKYLEEMNWSVEYDNDGPHNLVQTFVRNIDSFSDVLRNTTMDDHDIVYFCARQGFIPPGAAVMMLDQPLRGPGLAAGQTLLAASAMIPKTHITPADFRRAANEHPVETGSVILGFDVEALLTDDESFKMDVGHHSRHAASSLSNNPMLWSGSNAELYDPAAGYLNLDQAVEKSWNTIDISQPEEFDQTLTVGGMFDDGHLIPTVPDLEFMEYCSIWPQKS